MSADADPALALRRAFDATFALAPEAAEAHDDLLAIRLGGHAFALRTREVSALVRCPELVALPSALPELVGLVGVRGAAVPVYDLGALVGLGAAVGAPRWLALCGAAEPVALGFQVFEAHLRVPRAALSEPRDGAGAVAQVAQITGEEGRAVLALPALLGALRGRITAGASKGAKRP